MPGFIGIDILDGLRTGVGTLGNSSLLATTGMTALWGVFAGADSGLDDTGTAGTIRTATDVIRYHQQRRQKNSGCHEQT